tara:strand:+ start:1446 stop:1769 length:324 start_codon:yes stop_codon:yes gene_type:complete
MQSIVNRLNKSLEIREDLLEKVNNEEELLYLLTQYIQELINKDFNHLLWLLYRIDVGEKKVKEAINNSAPAEAAQIISKNILLREKEKVATRKIYRSENKGDSDWIF